MLHTELLEKLKDLGLMNENDEYIDDKIDIEMARHAFLTTLFRIKRENDATVYRDYVMEKVDFAFSVKQWWVLMQRLHPLLWSDFLHKCGVKVWQPS